MDEMLSTVPNSRRTKAIMDRIHQLIERYKQLRAMFSEFDGNNNVVGFSQLGPLHKPLVEHIRKLDVKLPWLIPAAVQRKFIYRSEGGAKNRNIDDEEAAATPDVVFSQLNRETDAQRELFKAYQKNTLPNGVNKYEYLFSKLDEINTSFIPETENTTATQLTRAQDVMENMDVIVKNYEDFYSTVNAATQKEWQRRHRTSSVCHPTLPIGCHPKERCSPTVGKIRLCSREHDTQRQNYGGFRGDVARTRRPIFARLLSRPPTSSTRPIYINITCRCFVCYVRRRR
jgi:hypothetical protein